MRVVNIHKREIPQPKEKVAKLLQTLATDNDMMLATDKWSPMILDNGLKVGSTGGHGPIGYSVVEYRPGTSIEFRFLRPKGFIGTHKFVIRPLDTNTTELEHCIDMNIGGWALFTWPFAIRWLHDAYIEDAFDKVENSFSVQRKRTEWNMWVKILRKLLKPKSN